LVSFTSSSPSGSPWASLYPAVGRAVADVAVYNDQLRTILDTERVVVSTGQRCQIVGIVDVLDVPAIGGEARGHIFVVCEIGVALDGDVVVVVNPAQVRKPQMSGDRRGFRGNSSIMSPSPQIAQML